MIGVVSAMNVVTSKRGEWYSRIDIRAIGLPVVTLALGITFAFTSDSFLSGPNIVNFSLAAAVLGCVSIGQTLPLLTGGLDLSVGSTIGLVSVVSAICSVHFGTWAGVGAGMMVGIIAGSVNGLLVTSVGVPPFIATLATLSAFSGLALYASGGVPIAGVPDSFSDFAYTRVLEIPVPVYILVAGFILAYVLLKHLRMGRYIYAVGANRTAARLAGIHTKRVEFMGYVVCSTFAAAAGIILTARVASGQPTLGQSQALVSVAAAVLGGVSLYGGRGSVIGVAVGFIFITLLENGLNLMGVSSYAQLIVIGVAMVLAIGWDQYLRRRAGDRTVG